MKSKEVKRRPVNLRRNRRTTISGLAKTDKVTTLYGKSGWQLVIESSNGLKIQNEKLPPAS